MATIPKASTTLPKICLLLITVINIVTADRRSVLSELYKQAAEQNRPLILVVDNHSKNEGVRHQGHGVYKGSKHVSDEAIPLHYMYPRNSISSTKQRNVKEKNSESKIDLIKYYLNRLLSQTQSGGSKKKSVRSDDRDEDLNQDNRYYREGRDRSDRRDRYRERNTDAKYNRRPLDRYYRPRENRDYKIRSKYNVNVQEDRDRHDRDRYDRDRYDRDRYDRDRYDRDRYDRDRYDRDRYDKDRRDRYRPIRDREDRYRSEKDRVDRDRADRYRQDRYRERDNYGDLYKNDRDNRDQYQSQNKYQSRYTDNYGANVIQNLLRYSNSLNCDAKYDCKGQCYQRARVLRESGDNCEDLCDAKFDCDDSAPKEEKEEKHEDAGGGCDARGSGESCGDEKNTNMSTRGYTDNGEEGNGNGCNKDGC